MDPTAILGLLGLAAAGIALVALLITLKARRSLDAAARDLANAVRELADQPDVRSELLTIIGWAHDWRRSHRGLVPQSLLDRLSEKLPVLL